MKLERFSPANCAPLTRRDTPKISLAKNGCFSISKGAMKLIKLAAGDRIQLARDEDDKANWYLIPIRDKKQDGFDLRESNQTGMLQLNSASLSGKIREDLFNANDTQTVTILVAGESTALPGGGAAWGLLAKSIV